MFVLGTGLFVLSSALCGFAPDVDTLLARIQAELAARTEVGFPPAVRMASVPATAGLNVLVVPPCRRRMLP